MLKPLRVLRIILFVKVFLEMTLRVVVIFNLLIEFKRILSSAYRKKKHTGRNNVQSIDRLILKNLHNKKDNYFKTCENVRKEII